jgi:hypothetical protein
VASIGDDASVFRIVALPQFNVDPLQLRAAMRAVAKDSKEGRSVPLAAVLSGVDGGAAVLDAVRQAQQEISRQEVKGRKAVEIIAKQFGLDPRSAILEAALQFIGTWEEKPMTKTGELNEFLDYLSFFREANGVIPMASDEDDNAVRLMTAHLAKGLEFSHIFILRANKGSFPNAYRETLVEFPNQLRDPDSAAEGEDKTLHDEEERRLFYVGMTRARDSLHVYARQGTGKEKSPAGLMRNLLQDSSLSGWLSSRSARGSQTSMDIFAETSPAYPSASRTRRLWTLMRDAPCNSSSSGTGECHARSLLPCGTGRRCTVCCAPITTPYVSAGQRATRNSSNYSERIWRARKFRTTTSMNCTSIRA